MELKARKADLFASVMDAEAPRRSIDRGRHPRPARPRVRLSHIRGDPGRPSGVGQELDGATGAVDADALASGIRRVRPQPHDGGETVLAGHDRAVGHHAPDLRDQPADRDEQRDQLGSVNAVTRMSPGSTSASAMSATTRARPRSSRRTRPARPAHPVAGPRAGRSPGGPSPSEVNTPRWGEHPVRGEGCLARRDERVVGPAGCARPGRTRRRSGRTRPPAPQDTRRHEPVGLLSRACL